MGVRLVQGSQKHRRRGQARPVLRQARPSSTEPFRTRQPPVCVAHQLHRGRDQHHADRGGVDEDCGGQTESHHLDYRVVAEHGAEEHRPVIEGRPATADPRMAMTTVPAAKITAFPAVATVAHTERSS